MKLTSWFNELNKNDAKIAGGKGASLGEMTQAKIPVPNGYVILSDSFEQFLKETDLNIEINSILGKVNHDDINSVEVASEQIKALILSRKMPKDIASKIEKKFKKLNSKYVAVRSSATSEDSADAAWAGQLESYLNTTKNDLLENVKKCWASLFTPRAIFYRFEKGLDKTKISVAVVVQKMINSKISGIAFSVHPITQDYNQVIIEAGLGLGEAIVSGSITPDAYVIEKKPRKIIDINIANQEKGLFRIEGGGNEWKETKNGNKQKLSKKQILKLSEIILKIENHYGFPCDIEWAYEKNKFYIVQSRPITTLIKEEKNIQNDNSIEKIINMEKYIQQGPATPIFFSCFFDDLPRMENSLGITYKKWILAFNKEYGEMAYSISDFENIYLHLEKKINSDSKLKKLQKKYDNLFKKQYNKLQKQKNLNSKIKEAKLLMGYSTGDAHSIEALAYKLTYKLKNILSNNIKSQKELNKIMNIVTTPEEQSFSSKFESDIRKLRLSNKNKKQEKIKKILKNYWWIKTNYAGSEELKEKDIINIKIKEETFNKKEIIKSKKEIIKEFNLKKEIIEIGKIISSLTIWQDKRKENIFKAIGEIEKLLSIIEKQTKIPKKLLRYMTIYELIDKKFEDKKYYKILKQRRNGCFFIGDNTKEPILKIFIGKKYEKYYKLGFLQKNFDKTLSGTCASTGKIIGEVKICKTLKDIKLFPKGKILVTGMTRPEYMPAIKKCKAIVTDEGGLTCHAAIISRELKIPCIIGTKYATKILKDGDLIEVKANHGQINIINKTKNENKENLPKYSLNWVKNLLETKDFDIKGARSNLPVAEIMFTAFAKPNILKKSYKEIFIPYKDQQIQQIILKENENLLERNVFETAVKNKNKFKKILNGATKIQKQIDTLSKKDLYNFSEKEILKYYKKLVKLSLNWWKYGSIGENKGLVIEEKIVPSLIKNHNLTGQEAFEFVLEYTAPKELSIFSKERMAFLDICIKTKEKKNAEKEIIEYSKKYFYARSGFYDFVDLSEENLKKLVKETNKNSSLKELKDEFNKLKNSINHLKQKQAKNKNLKLTKKEKDYLWYASLMNIWMDERKVSMMKHYNYLMRIMLEISKRKKINYNLICLMTLEELEQLICGQKPKIEQIKKRKKGVFLIYTKNKIIRFYEKEAKILLNSLPGKSDSNLLKGVVASKGNKNKVFGKIRVVKNPAKDEFNKNEILLTTMTRPEFVPIMKKAKAIITDEGGLTSHAAIVSRELGVPCIIGTKNATNILKNGQKVEIDIENGTVKILKNKN